MAAFAILAYDGIEPIDIGATYGVLSMARRIVPDLAFFVVAPGGGEVVMANGLRIVADHGLDDCPAHDVTMVLGGPGWEAASADPALLAFIASAPGTVASVCTGAMIVAGAGLLDGLPATTKSQILPGEARPLDLLGARHPGVAVTEARIVDAGRILTGGGVSLGIDMTLYLIARFHGAEAAHETARILEYSAAWQANAERLPDIAHPGAAGRTV